MTITTGYKVSENRDGVSEKGWYTFMETEARCAEWIEHYGYKNASFRPCRYVQTGRYKMPFEVDEDDLISTIRKCFSFAKVTVRDVSELEHYEKQNETYGSWDDVIEAGKSYIGNWNDDTKKFIKTHSSSLSDWQKLAMEWMSQNRTKFIIIETLAGKRNFLWRVVGWREYVDFGLPYHELGGEKNYVVKWEKPGSKVLVNVD